MIAAATASGPASALSCSVETGPVNFGTYDPRAALPTTSSGHVDVRCTCTLLIDCLAFGYTIEIQAGASGSVSNRKMIRTGGSETLSYSLTKDQLGLTPFGVGADGASVLYLLALFGSFQRTMVYGSVPAGQSVHTGGYSEAPHVVITY